MTHIVSKNGVFSIENIKCAEWHTPSSFTITYDAPNHSGMGAFTWSYSTEKTVKLEFEATESALAAMEVIKAKYGAVAA